MIRRLRRRHLRLILIVAVVVAVTLIAALRARTPVPAQDIPAEFGAP